VVLAKQFRWTPEQVDRMDPFFVDELMAYIDAEAEHQKELEKREKRKSGRRGRMR
jgi:hypothetical protein